jgi:amino acid transporter
LISPAVIINVLITYYLMVLKNPKNFSNAMVYIKLAIILFSYCGCFYIDIDNWTPFMPNGFSGVMGGVSFSVYIGFDAVSL